MPSIQESHPAVLDPCVVTPPTDTKASAEVTKKIAGDLTALASGQASGNLEETAKGQVEATFREIPESLVACELISRTVACALKRSDSDATRLTAMLISLQGQKCGSPPPPPPPPPPRAGELNGSGILIDEPGARISYAVEPGSPDRVRYVFRSQTHIRYWKSLDMFMGPADQTHKRVETKDDVHEVVIEHLAGDMYFPYRLEFWKGGFGGFGAKVLQRVFDRDANTGKTIVFTWERD